MNDYSHLYSLDTYHGHPEAEYHVGDKTVICDSRHAALAYVRGWNDRVNGLGNLTVDFIHPAMNHAYQLGYEDADGRTDLLEYPNVLESV